MKKLATVVAVIALIGTPAFAADLARKMPVKAPPPAPVPVFSWTGFYIGGNVGGRWGADEITTTTSPPDFVPGFAAAVDAVSAVTLKPQGVLAGVQAGYNWQMSNVVFGLEADVNWLSGTGSRNAVFGPLSTAGPGTFLINSSKDTFLATVRPRLGLAFQPGAFVYATGGLAVGTVKTTDTFGFPAVFFDTTSTSKTRTGWTVGGGLEYALLNNWSVKAEYLFVDLGKFDVGLVCTVAPCVIVNDQVVHHHYTDNIARVGLNYQFH